MKKIIYVIADKKEKKWLKWLWDNERNRHLYAYSSKGDAAFAREEICNVLGLNQKDYPIYRFVLEK